MWNSPTKWTEPQVRPQNIGQAHLPKSGETKVMQAVCNILSVYWINYVNELQTRQLYLMFFIQPTGIRIHSNIIFYAQNTNITSWNPLLAHPLQCHSGQVTCPVFNECTNRELPSWQRIVGWGDTYERKQNKLIGKSRTQKYSVWNLWKVNNNIVRFSWNETNAWQWYFQFLYVFWQ